ncbi:MAG: hypothetical protein JW801_08135 [Bacteroidales bacterium]|nr:hypothetical protein [Bacteroidales bacterium]
MKNANLQKMECVELPATDLKELNGGGIAYNPLLWPLVVYILLLQGIDIEAILFTD